MKILLQISALIVVFILVIYTNPNLFPPLYDRLENVVNLITQTERETPQDLSALPPTPDGTKELTTNVSGARNLSGRWFGFSPQGAIYTQSSICEYVADLSINIKQSGDAISGVINFSTKNTKDLNTEDFTPCSPSGYLVGDFQIEGSVSGTDVNFATTKKLGDPSLPIKFKGTFTSDIMSGAFERLPYSSSQLAELSRVSGTWIVTKSR